MYDELQGWLASQTWPDLKDRVQSDPGKTCYRHPYGFIVVRLAETAFPGWQIRVHLWPDAQEYDRLLSRNGTRNQQIHCHGFEVLSKVVMGGIEEKRYAIKPGKGVIYGVSSDFGVGKSELYRSTEDMTAVMRQTHVRNENDDVFHIPCGRFHSSAPALGPSVTAVATTTGGNTPSYVWSDGELGEFSSNERQVVVDEHLNEILAEHTKTYAAHHRLDDRWGSFVFVTDSQRRVLLVKPARRPEIWQPVGGRGDSRDATVVDTAVREVREETGLELAPATLHELVTLKRDVGLGNVHFWWTRCDESDAISLQYGEILAARWVPLPEAMELQLYPATRLAMEALQKRLAGHP